MITQVSNRKISIYTRNFFLIKSKKSASIYLLCPNRGINKIFQQVFKKILKNITKKSLQKNLYVEEFY